MKETLSEISKQAKEDPLKTVLDYMSGSFNIPVRFYLQDKIKKGLTEVLDIPKI